MNDLLSCLRRLLLTCAGASRRILAQCPETETAKYVGIGSAVLFTSLFAAITSTYALYKVFGNYAAAVPLGVLWGGFIFSFDRWMVATVRRPQQAIPRLLFATVIAFTISAPVEVRLFQDRIARQLLDTQQKQMVADQSFYNSISGLDRLRGEQSADEGSVHSDSQRIWEDPPGQLFQSALGSVRVADAHLRQVDRDAASTLPTLSARLGALRSGLQTLRGSQTAAAGVVPSAGVANTISSLQQEESTLISQVAAAQREQANANAALQSAQRDVDRLRGQYHAQVSQALAENKSRLVDLQASVAAAAATSAIGADHAKRVSQTAYSDNLTSDIEALESITRVRFSTLWWMQAIVFSLFWCIECAPILAKLMSDSGPYEIAVRADEAEACARSRAVTAWSESTAAAALFADAHEDASAAGLRLARVERARIFAEMVIGDVLEFLERAMEIEAKLMPQKLSQRDLDAARSALEIAKQHFWSVIGENLK